MKKILPILITVVISSATLFASNQVSFKIKQGSNDYYNEMTIDGDCNDAAVLKFESYIDDYPGWGMNKRRFDIHFNLFKEHASGAAVFVAAGDVLDKRLDTRVSTTAVYTFRQVMLDEGTYFATMEISTQNGNSDGIITSSQKLVVSLSNPLPKLFFNLSSEDGAYNGSTKNLPLKRCASKNLKLYFPQELRNNFNCARRISIDILNAETGNFATLTPFQKSVIGLPEYLDLRTVLATQMEVGYPTTMDLEFRVYIDEASPGFENRQIFIGSAFTELEHCDFETYSEQYADMRNTTDLIKGKFMSDKGECFFGLKDGKYPVFYVWNGFWWEQRYGTEIESVYLEFYNSQFGNMRDCEKFVAGDFDGDGLDEILGIDVDGKKAIVFKYYKSIAAILATQFSQNEQIANYSENLIALDHDGDGDDEIIGRSADDPNWITMFGYDDSNNWEWLWSTQGDYSHDLYQLRENYRVANANHDKKDEIFAYQGNKAKLLQFKWVNSKLECTPIWEDNINANTKVGWSFPLTTPSSEDLETQIMWQDIDCDGIQELIYIHRRSDEKPSWFTYVEFDEANNTWKWDYSNMGSGFIGDLWMPAWGTAYGDHTQWFTIRPDDSSAPVLVQHTINLNNSSAPNNLMTTIGSVKCEKPKATNVGPKMDLSGQELSSNSSNSKELLDVEIFPIPANPAELLFFNIEEGVDIDEVRVVNSIGLEEEVIQHSANAINIEQLNSGIYIIQLLQQGTVVSIETISVTE